MKKVMLFIGIFFMSLIGYSENFKGTDKERRKCIQGENRSYKKCYW